MKIARGVSISAQLKFPAKKSAVKAVFDSFENLNCYFGNLGNHFEFDGRCFDRPHLQGTVVASVSYSRARTGIMQFYPIPIATFTEAASEEFEKTALLRMRAWFAGQTSKPDTALLGHEQLIVTWNGSIFGYSTVKFL